VDEKILDKIRKCFALAKSSNEHEAAIALRQAQKLMQQHSITDFDVAHADIREESTRAGAARRPVHWEGALATHVAAAFDCVVYLESGFSGRWVFVGVSPSVEIARYAFDVLFRQVKRARADYIKTTLKRCTTTRTRRADLFCEGWVSEATRLVSKLVNESEAARIMTYLSHKHDKMTPLRHINRNAGRNLTFREYDDLMTGKCAGKRAQINHGVGTDSSAQLTSNCPAHSSPRQ
jgi:hypothetical protein